MPQQDTKQAIYATNLRQKFGYPLRSPSPGEDDQLGVWIGDVGYVNEHGQFVVLWNICHGNPPSGLPQYDRIPPVEDLLQASPLDKNILTTGVKRGKRQPSDPYKFTTKSNAGAILILPSGAKLYELKDQKKLDEFKDLAANNGLSWCRFAEQDSLCLITGLYRTRSWALGSFRGCSSGDVINVKKSSDNAIYEWSAPFDIDSHSCSDDMFENQTIFIRGFKMIKKDNGIELEHMGMDGAGGEEDVESGEEDAEDAKGAEGAESMEHAGSGVAGAGGVADAGFGVEGAGKRRSSLASSIAAYFIQRIRKR